MMEIPRCLIGRKPAILAAMVTAFVFVSFVVVPSVFGFVATKQSQSDAINSLAIYQSEIRADGDIQKEWERLVQNSSLSRGLMSGSSTEQAQAQLQTEIKDIIENNNGQVRSALPLPPSPTGGTDRVSIQYDITLPASHLLDVLYAIENHVPYLFIENVNISAPPAGYGLASTATEINLEIRWTITGYRWVVPK